MKATAVPSASEQWLTKSVGFPGRGSVFAPSGVASFIPHCPHLHLSGPGEDQPQILLAQRERGHSVRSSSPGRPAALGMRHKPVGCRGRTAGSWLGHLCRHLCFSGWDCGEGTRTRGAPETQLGPARELAGVQLQGGGVPPALPQGSGQSRAQSHSSSLWSGGSPGVSG